MNNNQGNDQTHPPHQPQIEEKEAIPTEQLTANMISAGAQQLEEKQPTPKLVTPPPPMMAQTPKKSPSTSPTIQNNSPAVATMDDGSQIPHSGTQSAFSKYSTAALLQNCGGQEGGKKSPAHGAEAPKSRSAQQTQNQSNVPPRSTTAATAYGLEAMMSGLNGQQLGMLAMTDPQQLLAQLETVSIFCWGNRLTWRRL